MNSIYGDKIKEDLMERYTHSQIRRQFKMAVLPKLIHRFNAVSIKILTDLSLELDDLILKSIWKGKGHSI